MIDPGIETGDGIVRHVRQGDHGDKLAPGVSGKRAGSKPGKGKHVQPTAKPMEQAAKTQGQSLLVIIEACVVPKVEERIVQAAQERKNGAKSGESRKRHLPDSLGGGIWKPHRQFPSGKGVVELFKVYEIRFGGVPHVRKGRCPS